MPDSSQACKEFIPRPRKTLEVLNFLPHRPNHDIGSIQKSLVTSTCAINQFCDAVFIYFSLNVSCIPYTPETPGPPSFAYPTN